MLAGRAELAYRHATSAMPHAQERLAMLPAVQATAWFGLPALRMTV
jgi:hypothetical protein